MHQLAFTVFGFQVHWYGVMAALGFFAAVLVLHALKKHAKLSGDQIIDLSWLAMLAGIIGARLFYVVQFWSKQFQDTPWEIIRIDKGGLVFYGGFIAAIATIALHCWRKKISFPRVMDIFAPALAIAHAFGRVGCFLQGCCYGKPGAAPWAVVFPEDSEPGMRYCNIPLHPVQLYEAIGNVLIFGIMLMLVKKLKAGQTAALYLVFYGIMRFSNEFFRGDHVDFFLGFTPAQTIGLFLIPAGLGLFFYLGKRAANDHDEQAA